MNPSLNWKYLPDAITEAEIKLKLKWSLIYTHPPLDFAPGAFEGL
jgi:hypothetical protein